MLIQKRLKKEYSEIGDKRAVSVKWYQIKERYVMSRLIHMSVLVCICFCCLFGVAFAGSATVSWQPNSEPDLKGYNVYVGTASRTYGTPFYVDKAQTSHTFANLSEGTYYFCVTAVDLAGNESGFSQEASKMIQDIIAPSIPQGVTVK